MSLVNLLVGRPLASDEQDEQKIGPVAGVAAMGLDGLTSSAYGPEAALTVLIPLGAVGLSWIGPITAVILALLLMLYLSYRQTIIAYPVNGGSYTVAAENLGVWAGLLAAAALMIDYVLNVAVGISAGVAALVSALPALHSYTLLLCLVILGLITLLNLRGTLETGILLAIPTYVFVACLSLVLILGIVRALQSGGHPQAVVAPPPLPPATAALSVWLLLRSFASGCTAMTGIEAVSNGVSAFKKPTVINATRTLTMIVVLLTFFLGSIAYLIHAYGVGAIVQDRPGYQSVLSQLTGAVVGRGWFYYVTLASLLAVLCLSANTSFVDFPRLSRLIARDDFLPRAFATVGRRLVYTVGIIFLAVTAGLLLAVFRGITDRLIPLFAVGALLAFTLSQAGMVFHWRRQLHDAHAKDSDHRGRLRIRKWVNGVGAVATAAALVVVLAAKFSEGAWIVVVAFPVLIMTFHGVHCYYEKIHLQTQAQRPLNLANNPPPVVLVPIKAWNRLTEKTLRFAMWLSSDLIVVHLSNLTGEEAEEEERQLQERWKREVEEPARAARVTVPQFIMARSPYRSLVAPLLDQINRLKDQYSGRAIALVIPEIIGTHWWQALLHRGKAARLRKALVKRRDHRVVLIRVPWYVEA